MTTTYPTTLDTFSAKVDNVTTVQAADMNNVQDAIVATETEVTAIRAKVGSQVLARTFDDRVVTPEIVSPTDHFQSGVIPTGYAWAATSGVIFGTPTTLAYALNGDYLGVTATAATRRHFLYKSIANSLAAWNGKVFDIAVRGGGPCEIGVRIDDGGSASTDRFLEFYSSAVANDGTHKLEARRQETTSGGVTTTAMASTEKTFELPYVIRILVNATPAIVCYMISMDGQVQSKLTTGTLNWVPSAGRVGIFVKEAGFYSMVDWFYTTF